MSEDNLLDHVCRRCYGDGYPSCQCVIDEDEPAASSPAVSITVPVADDKQHQSLCARCGHSWTSLYIDFAEPCPNCDPPVLVGRCELPPDMSIADLRARLKHLQNEGTPNVALGEIIMHTDRIRELEAALRNVLAIVDGRGYMPPEHQRALWTARQVIGGAR